MNRIFVPVILFAYARPDHLSKTLDCLRENRVPMIYAFSDAARTPDRSEAVTQVRKMLRAINWCEVKILEREKNLGLGSSILAGVTEVLAKHEAAIIFEDDLICVPGTYEYLSLALDQYRNDERVLSVTGWTHPLVTPRDVRDQPYFDGRAECWIWGTWARAWQGMGRDATSLMNQCKDQGIDIYKYGSDLVDMAKVELKQNIWAVRFLYLHILKKGLCLRPPWSMVEHIGFDFLATNAVDSGIWKSLPLRSCPPFPEKVIEPEENPECEKLWRLAYGGRPNQLKRLYRFTRHLAKKALRSILV